MALLRQGTKEPPPNPTPPHFLHHAKRVSRNWLINRLTERDVRFEIIRDQRSFFDRTLLTKAKPTQTDSPIKQTTFQ